MRSKRGWRRFLAVGWLILGALGAICIRQWQIHVREVEARADEAERTREEVARRRAVEERLRIARELHDSLTHNISVIKVQAGVAAHIARKRGEEVPPALLAIQEASADAVRELRSTLGALRADDADGNGLDRLPQLIERFQESGVLASTRVSGVPRPLPGEVDRTAYRIIQESLTNIARHAPSAVATVRLHHTADALVVCVEDDGPFLAEDPVPGLGLIGMRERVTALGGGLRAERGTSSGFRVEAVLPLEPS